MGFFTWLFGKRQAPEQSEKVKFDFLIYDEYEEIDHNQWYQKSSWTNKNFVSYKGIWDSDWKWSDEGKVKVVGLSHGSRSAHFMLLAREKNFKMYLERETENPVNPNALKVMASVEGDDGLVSRHVGYLPDDVANKYAGIDLDIRPDSAFLPTSNDMNLGVKVALLVRSARYLKNKKI
jgi:hypothetical protein